MRHLSAQILISKAMAFRYFMCDLNTFNINSKLCAYLRCNLWYYRRELRSFCQGLFSHPASVLFLRAHHQFKQVLCSNLHTCRAHVPSGTALNNHTLITMLCVRMQVHRYQGEFPQAGNLFSSVVCRCQWILMWLSGDEISYVMGCSYRRISFRVFGVEQLLNAPQYIMDIFC